MHSDISRGKTEIRIDYGWHFRQKRRKNQGFV